MPLTPIQVKRNLVASYKTNKRRLKLKTLIRNFSLSSEIMFFCNDNCNLQLATKVGTFSGYVQFSPFALAATGGQQQQQQQPQQRATPAIKIESVPTLDRRQHSHTQSHTHTHIAKRLAALATRLPSVHCCR